MDIENSLPAYVMKRVQVYSHTEFPNQPKTLKQKVSVYFTEELVFRAVVNVSLSLLDKEQVVKVS